MQRMGTSYTTYCFIPRSHIYLFHVDIITSPSMENIVLFSHDAKNHNTV